MNAECGISNSSGLGQFSRDGFQMLPGLFLEEECDGLAAELSYCFDQQQNSARTKIGGVRNLLRASPRVAQLASSPRLISILEKLVEATAFPVRAIFFDKTAEANWRVPWHQDLAIAVAERIETSGYGGWSLKDGVNHVQPPQDILESMATVRLHLDDCDAGNGALKVIPNSHLRGKLDATEIAEWTKRAAVSCEVPKGGALLMRPLLLHASSPAENPSHRRVLHIEYATQELPNHLKWFEC